MNHNKKFLMLNCNKCTNCGDYISCSCRMMELNGKRIQYNLLPGTPPVIGIYSGYISKRSKDIVNMLAQFHDIKVAYYEYKMSTHHAITGINLDKIPVGVMVNIINLLEN